MSEPTVHRLIPSTSPTIGLGRMLRMLRQQRGRLVLTVDDDNVATVTVAEPDKGEFVGVQMPADRLSLRKLGVSCGIIAAEMSR